jgi:hypothetical protein
MAAGVTITAIFTYRHVAAPRSSVGSPNQMPVTPPSLAPPAKLATEFTQLETRLQAKLGVAISAVGNGQIVTTWGDWQEGPAWSTMKVPLVIAAYRQQKPPQVTDVMRAVITGSDNTAAESLWEQLGDPATAAERLQQILRQNNDPTTVESQKIRPEFTAFGQTIWSLVNQVRFTANAFCNSENEPIFALMNQIEADQKWGIGNIAATPFKGGWGPSPSGNYLVRQFGVLTTPAGKVAVAIAAEPASGSFDDGTKDLGAVGRWLTDHLEVLPAGQCSR